MQIGTLSDRTGLSLDTIRFYEKAGLITPAHWTRRPNGYKDYHEAAVERVALVKMAKHLGFSLARIRGLIGLWESGAFSPDQKAALLEEKIGELEALVAELQRSQAALRRRVTLLRDPRHAG